MVFRVEDLTSRMTHTHTHARTHARTRARTHTRARTYVLTYAHTPPTLCVIGMHLSEQFSERYYKACAFAKKNCRHGWSITPSLLSRSVMPGQRWWRDECLMQPGTDVPKKQVLSPQHAEQYGHNLPKLPLMHLHGC